MVKSFPASSVVITNLRYVSIRGVRMTCRAVVLTDNPDLNEGKERRYHLDGYGQSCVWHVFDLFLKTSTYKWIPAAQRDGFPHPSNGVLQVDEVAQGPTDVQLFVDNYDLGINFETITGTWTPGPEHEDWFQYNQCVGKRVFDQSCAVIEALNYQHNLLLPIALPPAAARRFFDEDGSSLRRGAL